MWFVLSFLLGSSWIVHRKAQLFPLSPRYYLMASNHHVRKLNPSLTLPLEAVFQAFKPHFQPTLSTGDALEADQVSWLHQG